MSIDVMRYARRADGWDPSAATAFTAAKCMEGRNSVMTTYIGKSGESTTFPVAYPEEAILSFAGSEFGGGDCVGLPVRSSPVQFLDQSQRGAFSRPALR